MPSDLAPAWLVLDQVSFGYGRGPDVNRGLSLALGPGITGLLGPNGAGKSTLMRMLATLARPRSGRILWHGDDIAREPDALRATLGYLPQDFGVYPALTAREFLAFLAAVKGLPARATAGRVDACLAQVGLADAADRPLAGFSGGMRQRVGIAQALLNDPRLLVVDEPTVGLDPGERLRFRHLLTELAGERLVLLSTHIVSDVEASAAAIAVMKDGRLLFHGTPGALVEAARGRAWDWAIPPAQLAAARRAFVVSQSLHRGDSVRLRVLGARPPGPGAQPVEPTLEDAYTDLLAREPAPPRPFAPAAPRAALEA
ncbi:MAG: ABC transporter ATP-binding protein [Burkholderiaceae bacterium]